MPYDALPMSEFSTKGRGRWPAFAVGAATCLLLAGCLLPVEVYFLVLAAVLLLSAIPLIVTTLLEAPVHGLALLLVSALLIPGEISSAEATRVTFCLVVTAMLCAVWLLGLVVSSRPTRPPASRPVVAVIAFMAVALLSLVVGQSPWFDAPAAPLRAQVGGLALFLLSGGVFLMVGHQVASQAQLERLTWVFVGVGSVAVVTSVFPWLRIRIGSVAISNADSIGSAFWTWLVAVTASQGLFNRGLARSTRLVLGLVCVAALMRGLVLAFSWVSGWLPPLVALLTILLLRFPRCTLSGALLAMAPTLFAGGPALSALMVHERYSWMTRFEALSVMRQVIEVNPWLGFGPANYYQYTALFPILGWHVSFSSHNNYVDLLAQTGVIGLAIFLWFAFEMARLAWKLRSRVAVGFGQAYVAGAVGGLAGGLVSGFLADWIVPFAYNIGIRGFRSSLLFWLFLGGLLALDRLSRPSFRNGGVRRD